MAIIDFPTAGTVGDIYRPPGQDTTYVLSRNVGGQGIWDVQSSTLSRKIDIFLGTPGLIETGITVEGIANVQRQSFQSNGFFTYYFSNLRVDSGLINNDDTNGALGMFSADELPTNASTNFNLIG